MLKGTECVDSIGRATIFLLWTPAVASSRWKYLSKTKIRRDLPWLIDLHGICEDAVSTTERPWDASTLHGRYSVICEVVLNVLTQLRGTFISKKCTLSTTKIDNLGHIISPDPRKVTSHILDVTNGLRTTKIVTKLKWHSRFGNVHALYVTIFAHIGKRDTKLDRTND